MEQVAPRTLELRWQIVCAAIGPFGAVSVYLLATRWPVYRFTDVSDYAALAVSVFIGAAFVLMLPIRGFRRLWVLIVYVPLLATLLVVYTFWFVAVVFKDGL
jgi:hypothetical protein